ncbi:ATP-binding response regulator [Noviherbaspirillum autotrophicum]|uniref:ATP-binding response regulator n=1 Tax=Noviherbaspirillum autotrophicum TaxID=709839 RepID=UPI0009FBC1A5|nr:response regulator [Noviherbaspirillum autotrophicum]
MFVPKVLLVNDDSASLLALSSLLVDRDGYEVIMARSGEEALRHVLNHDFAVILLDVSMPSMDGFETAEAIHSHPRSASVPIIFVTAHYADEMNRLKGYQKGAVDYLFTPIIPQILQSKVAVFVELAKKNMQLQYQKHDLEKLNDELQAQRWLDLQHINERKQAEEALRQSQNELRELASYQERVKEDERKRIAREIHDELGQNLLALRIDIAMLHARTASTHPKLNGKVHAVLDHIDATMKAMRSIINNLRPTVLDLGLTAAIEWQVKEFQRRTGIACELELSDKELMVDDSRATALFRVLQESLNNVFRHARATKTKIEVYQTDNRLYMRVADNGVGIFPGCRRKANSFGLIGMKERISTLGGELDIDTAQDRGTALTVSIPVDAAHESACDEHAAVDGKPRGKRANDAAKDNNRASSVHSVATRRKKTLQDASSAQ